ncbi:hypothetical protein P9265_21380 [Schinkia azotoformans]|uniref:GGDEF domain-containing protein n=1 Tax=Schinkia azotoformans TaxID=1454 RepID=UPI002DBECEFB|nr:hypothetical protein [Schinkia azotoformans]MEC1722615.1 hypothetical protein [Schinkia azotoformans]MED4354834.1 hypothetical protein [Schinkia azotoformans]MED4415430.1 hypothetical protein [Schinkia azotoformans]
MYIIPFHPMIFELIPKNHIFGRWGGEEFLLICPETSKIEALPSWGIHGALLSRADKGLYHAKDTGRNKAQLYQETDMQHE